MLITYSSRSGPIADFPFTDSQGRRRQAAWRSPTVAEGELSRLGAVGRLTLCIKYFRCLFRLLYLKCTTISEDEQ